MEELIIETGNTCFGDIMIVNEVDYEDLEESTINEIFEIVMLDSHNKRELFKLALDLIDGEYMDSSHSSCDQCGNFNDWTKKKFILDER